ncbi:ester cyclase [Kribbella sp. NPDC026611]|uniref:ester cyclase n=1 Tax=Kribbella sp. NPDC026611 TaxID=3154911 RepID=UPI0033CBE923
MTHDNLESTYLAYLDALNARRFDALDRYVCDELVYNDRPLTREEYAAMIAEDTRAVPDLRYEAHLLSTHGDIVACRLWFDCTPKTTFLGLEPTGRPVSFAEHVFYRFEGERIAHVWSLIDREAVASQFDR